eukprot:3766869-Rhodomonas_salina.2
MELVGPIFKILPLPRQKIGEDRTRRNKSQSDNDIFICVAVPVERQRFGSWRVLGCCQRGPKERKLSSRRNSVERWLFGALES